MATIDYEDSDAEVRLVRMGGRLDGPGIDLISAKFAALACTQSKRVVVDLRTVTYIASVGIRELVSNAKANKQRGGKFVIFVGDNADVFNTLDTTGIGSFISVFQDLTQAVAAVNS